MTTKTDLIHKDNLLDEIQKYGNSFIDEQCRIIPLDKFTTLFVYKHGSFLSEWMFRIRTDNLKYKLHCENLAGMEILFPIISKGTESRQRLIKH